MATIRNTPKPITLFTPYFKTGDVSRQKELNECLARNLENRFIDRIVLLIDDKSTLPFKSEKLEIINIPERPTYAKWLEITLAMKLNGPVVLANSDIYFDETIALIPHVLNKPSVFMALSRWEVQDNDIRMHTSPHWSQDVWAVSPDDIGLKGLFDRLNFRLGVPRCDNKIAYVFATAGWAIRNPCNFIRAYHLHETQLRNYDKKLDTTIIGGVAYVEPCQALEQNSALHFDIWSTRSHEVIRLSLNNSLQLWKQHKENTQSFEAHDLPPFKKPKTSNVNSRLDLFRNGKCIYRTTRGIGIYENDQWLLAAPSLDPRQWMLVDKSNPLTLEFTSTFFKPVLELHLPTITERPKNNDDVNFWQYPCKTELQALQNHQAISSPVINQFKRTISVYIGLPWATYIDNKQFPADIIKKTNEHLTFLTKLAERLGYKLDVHTVCQHIRWQNMLEIAEKIGITDLTISHCTSKSQKIISTRKYGLRVHPWTLYAVNYCDRNRNQGLEIGKPMETRKYLASFIGAHMPHYLNNIRIRLYEELSALKKEDIIVILGELWHFNKVVYVDQVSNKKVSSDKPIDLDDATIKYNQILSNSRFSLCPEGAGPNTLRFWESIAVGAVPVLFNRALKFPESISNEISDLCLFWEKNVFGHNLYEWLCSFSMAELNERSKKLLEIYKKAENLTCFR